MAKKLEGETRRGGEGEKIRTLNLGAGDKIVAGAVNHDLRKHRPEIDYVWDLNDRPWPWESNAFDRVLATSVFEHLRITLVESLDECWRILAPGGRLRVKVPFCRSESAYADPTHYWRYSLTTFDYFDPETESGKKYAFYMDHKWKVLKVRLNPEKTSIIATLEPRKD